MKETQTLSELCHSRFKVSGNNWHTYVHINVEEYTSEQDVWAEAATMGVEKYQVGEYSRTDMDNDRVGFGRLIIVQDEEGNKKGIRSDLILANAGLHSEATRLRKIIDGK